MTRDNRIDRGNPFDWSRASDDYARFRDIYPPSFYREVLDTGLLKPGCRVLDIGTGTGVLPRHLAVTGADFTGIDPSPGQIEQARRLSAARGLKTNFHVQSAEDADFPDASFDVVLACQCHIYLDMSRALPNIHRMLKPGGRLVLLWMAWLPDEDPLAQATEQLVLQYSPYWSGARAKRHEIPLPPEAEGLFVPEQSRVWDVEVPFTQDTWRGRIRACRGVGASLEPEQVEEFDRKLRDLLMHMAPPDFTVLHYAAMRLLKKEEVPRQRGSTTVGAAVC